MYGHFDEADVADDYLQLLRINSVTRRLALSEHAAWRRAMREKAQADELRIRTWSRDGSPATVWAVLPGSALTEDERWRYAQRLSWLQEE